MPIDFITKPGLHAIKAETTIVIFLILSSLKSKNFQLIVEIKFTLVNEHTPYTIILIMIKIILNFTKKIENGSISWRQML